MKSIFCAAIVLFAAVVGGFAQEKTITKADFDALYKSPGKWAPARWNGKSYRMITTTEIKTRGAAEIVSTSTHTMNFAAPTVSRFVSESKTGDKITRTESIRINDKTYKRQDGGAWIEGTIEASAPPPPAPAATPDEQTEKQFEYKYLGTEKLGDQTANVYSEIIKAKGVDAKTGKEKLYTFTNKFWFTEDGILLKEEKFTDRHSDKNGVIVRMTHIWELDPKIKIEAPTVN